MLFLHLWVQHSDCSGASCRYGWTAFAEDGTVENLVRSETYHGTDEIRQMLQGMHREGRRYEIVELKLNGDSITTQVEVSDGGFVWVQKRFMLP